MILVHCSLNAIGLYCKCVLDQWFGPEGPMLHIFVRFFSVTLTGGLLGAWKSLECAEQGPPGHGLGNPAVDDKTASPAVRCLFDFVRDPASVCTSIEASV